MDKLRHTDITRTLIERIADGTYPLGSLLPPEPQLSELLGSTRYTVRRALAELEQLGLLSRKKNVGTRVERCEPVQDHQQTLTSVADLAQFGATHVRQVVRGKEIVADLALAKLLGVPGGSRWFCISSIRLDEARGKVPVGWTDTYLLPEFADVMKAAKKEPRMLISALVEARYGRSVAHVRQEVGAIAMPDKLARELNTEAGAPALRVVRRYSDSARQAFELTVTVHPADRFTFAIDLNRSR